jgi:DNA-binding NtrC family response regulator
MAQQLNILLVDDEPDIVNVITMMLEQHGHVVHGFIDPIKALAHPKKSDVIISDVRMPGMNGFQLVKAAKKINPALKVVLMTAFEINKNEWQKTLPSTEVDQFLLKPVRASQLIEVIEKCAPVVH